MGGSPGRPYHIMMIGDFPQTGEGAEGSRFMTYKVFVDDNFHYMDESERYALGEYATLE